MTLSECVCMRCDSKYRLKIHGKHANDGKLISRKHSYELNYIIFYAVAVSRCETLEFYQFEIEKSIYEQL